MYQQHPRENLANKGLALHAWPQSQRTLSHWASGQKWPLRLEYLQFLRFQMLYCSWKRFLRTHSCTQGHCRLSKRYSTLLHRHIQWMWCLFMSSTDVILAVYSGHRALQDSRLYRDVMDTFDLNPWLPGSCPSAAYHVLSPKAYNILCPYWNLINDQGPTVILAKCKHIRNTLAIRAASTASKRYPCTLNATFCNTTFACSTTKIHTCRSFAFLKKTTLTSAHQKRVLPDTL